MEGPVDIVMKKKMNIWSVVVLWFQTKWHHVAMACAQMSQKHVHVSTINFPHLVTEQKLLIKEFDDTACNHVI